LLSNKKENFLRFILFFSIFSCSPDSVEDEVLNGEWTLTNISCFCGFPDPPDFNMTQIQFLSSQNEVIVINNGESTYFREEGTYSYTGRGNRITFEDGQSFDFEISGSSLQLIFVDEPNIADDEVTYSFER